MPPLLAEWLYEAGIGEARAALVAAGHIVEMAIEIEGDGPRAGTIVAARLLRGADGTGRGRVLLAGGGEADLAPVPPALAEGAGLHVEIVREALDERGTLKPPRARAVGLDVPLGDGPDLRARIAATGQPVRRLDRGADLLEAHGWSEALEEAASGLVARPEAMLRISLTPAMTLIDIDGAGPAPALASAGARLAGETIRRFGIVGSIGIDLPTLAAKADRQAAAAALDAVLPPPFERTAVNGFGFLQIVRRRVRPALPELLAADPSAAAARALLRRAERAGGHGAVTITAALGIITAIAARPLWRDLLARRIGADVRLREMPGLAISAGHVQRDYP